MEKIATKYILQYNNKQTNKMFKTNVCKSNKSNTIINAIAVVFPSMEIRE